MYRTDDLALAVTLALNGYKHKLDKLTDRKAVWDFSFKASEEEDFYDVVDDFWEFAAKVEPRAFSLRWAEMRRELFDLIPPIDRQPVRPATSATP